VCTVIGSKPHVQGKEKEFAKIQNSDRERKDREGWGECGGGIAEQLVK
jgi:hypothetical protein